MRPKEVWQSGGVVGRETKVRANKQKPSPRTQTNITNKKHINRKNKETKTETE